MIRETVKTRVNKNLERMLLMSKRELAIQLLDEVPEYKLGYVLAFIQGLTADESGDDAYCEALYQDYLSAPEEDKETVSLEDAAKMLGVSLGV